MYSRIIFFEYISDFLVLIVIGRLLAKFSISPQLPSFHPKMEPRALSDDAYFMILHCGLVEISGHTIS
jgi:hypothetical protein